MRQPSSNRHGYASSHECVAAGRLFLLMTFSLLLMMPWMEYAWHFDKFLSGGQDFELGLLSVIVLLCLVVVLLQQSKTELLSLVRKTRWLPVSQQAIPWKLTGSRAWNATFSAVPLPVSKSNAGNFPIQV